MSDSNQNAEVSKADHYRFADFIGSIQNSLNPNKGKWKDISTAPKEPVEFYVGKWVGEKLWNDDHTQFVWARPPVFEQTVSHDHTHEDLFEGVRGWNHRNGPWDGKAEFWCELIDAPPMKDPVAVPALPKKDSNKEG